ncbi:MAG: hypothetical protein ACYC9Y_14415 [Candidatus Methylomirabilia bacterium]
MSWVGTLGRRLFRLALLWLAMIPVLFAVSFAYDAVVHPRDMNLPGLLAVGSVYYYIFRPWGVGLLIAGFVLRRFGDS